jgi:homospermidine synthase
VSHFVKEALTIADWLTVGPRRQPQWRPTVHYAYRPCDDALLSLHELAGADWRMPQRQRHLVEDIAGGTDELGVLIGGPAGGALWLGSRLTAAQAREAAPGNSATTLQVAAGVMAAVRTDWTPLEGRSHDLDPPPEPADPWQFANVRVS